jgi:putative membrane protein
MGIFGTSASLFADLSLVLELLILGAFFVGYRYAMMKRSNEHYKIMTGAFSLNLVFVGTYMIKSLLSEGSTGFSGPETIKDLVYLPTVVVHGISSVLAFVLAGITLYYGYSHTVQKKHRVFPNKSDRFKHRILGLLTISTWAFAFITVFIFDLLLYGIY